MEKTAVVNIFALFQCGHVTQIRGPFKAELEINSDLVAQLVAVGYVYITPRCNNRASKECLQRFN